MVRTQPHRIHRCTKITETKQRPLGGIFAFENALKKAL